MMGLGRLRHLCDACVRQVPPAPPWVHLVAPEALDSKGVPVPDEALPWMHCGSNRALGCGHGPAQALTLAHA